MPPKKKSEPSKKTVIKQKEKVIEDKTFGLKNKKGKKQQTFIKQVTTQVKYGGHMSAQKLAADQHDAKKKKLLEEEINKEMGAIFRPAAVAQKLSAGADPKSVLCLFYKQGMCTKGDKCKFSHNMELERKAEKKSMYVDSRDLEEDTMDTWDEEKLKAVVNQKHGGKIKPTTDIVCKFFLKAIEDGKYGWFWDCPNGGNCIYRHALPPGFVFKTKKKGPDEENEGTKISLEQLVEEEREKMLSSGKILTKVTLDTFLGWKKRKLKEKQSFADEQAEKRKEAFKAGKTVGISGREMFEFNPNLIQEEDDDDEEGETVYYSRKQEDDSDDDDSGTVAHPLVDVTNYISGEGFVGLESRLHEEEENDPPGAVGGAGISDQNNDVEIDENLFTGDIEVDESLFVVDELGLEEDDHSSNDEND